VGADVREPFVARSPEAARWFTPDDRGRWQADLYGLARDALAGAGVTNVHGGGFCTYSEQHRFFSHRREGPCGRMATLVWLEPTP
jgi:copper oxidase (laccase) domain-containing protein